MPSPLRHRCVTVASTWRGCASTQQTWRLLARGAGSARSARSVSSDKMLADASRTAQRDLSGGNVSSSRPVGCGRALGRPAGPQPDQSKRCGGGRRPGVGPCRRSRHGRLPAQSDGDTRGCRGATGCGQTGAPPLLARRAAHVPRRHDRRAPARRATCRPCPSPQRGDNRPHRRRHHARGRGQLRSGASPWRRGR
jgi:hypothetical protein